VNLCEVYYDFCRAVDAATARAALLDLTAAGVMRIEYLSAEFCERVGSIKAANRVSLADCFALALTGAFDAKLLTSDRHEFEIFANRSEYRIHFMR
jgi:predicted nucleic acid-binding protein